jgi:uncharacterized protein (TIGR00266 family)
VQEEILFAPSYAMAHVTLGQGEELTVEAGSMVAMSEGLAMETGVAGGSWLGALVRRLLGGETVFVNRFRGPGEVYVAPAVTGDIAVQKLDGHRRILIQGSSYLAHTGNVELKIRFGGLRTLMGSEGAFLLEAGGHGQIWLNCYGALREVDVPEAGFVVDTGHMVAFDATLEYSLKAAGGLLTSFTSGEGLVFHVGGKGKVWLQSRNEGTLVSWIQRYLPG